MYVGTEPKEFIEKNFDKGNFPKVLYSFSYLIQRSIKALQGSRKLLMKDIGEAFKVS